MERGSTKREIKKVLSERGYSNHAIRHLERLYSGATVTEVIPVPKFCVPVETLTKLYGEIPEDVKKKIVERGKK